MAGSESAVTETPKDANQGTPSAAELRGKTVLGDAVVKQEVKVIDQVLRAAADTGQVRTVITGGEGIQMAGKYKYGSWFCIEEVFQYGAVLKNSTGDEKDAETKHYSGFTSLNKLGFIDNMIMPQLLKHMKSTLGENCFIEHSRINAVLGHYRKLGYQIHPGNWFDATVPYAIKWVINWNNTIMDHITMIDNTLCIGKPSNNVPLGAAERDGSLDAAGTPNPVGNFARPQIDGTKLEFFGLGNKGFGKISVYPADGKMGVTDDPSSPYYGNTNNVGFKLIGQALSAGDFAGTTDGGGSSAGLSAMYSLIGSLAGGVGQVIGDLTKTGLFWGEVGQLGGSDYATHSGLRNTGDGTTPDIDNIDLYEANGRPWGSAGSSYSPEGAGSDYEPKGGGKGDDGGDSDAGGIGGTGIGGEGPGIAT